MMTEEFISFISSVFALVADFLIYSPVKYVLMLFMLCGIINIILRLKRG